MTKIIGYGITA